MEFPDDDFEFFFQHDMKIEIYFVYMKERSAEMKFWPAAKVSGAKPEHAGFHV
ncbi:MAG: hypothetical protein GY795_14710 [Desulfobacterales bacterium]|nr:hypothetical protein [Desulfobacterales bacterium]